MPVSSPSSRRAPCRLVSPATTAPPEFSQQPGEASFSGLRSVSKKSPRELTTQTDTA